MKRAKNMGEGRAEPPTAYAVLADPSVTQWSERAAGCDQWE